MTVRHPDWAADGLTQASRVIPVVRSSELASAIVTRSLTPSNDRAPPYFPAVDQVAPEMVPLLPNPEVSFTVGPLPSLKPRASTSPVAVAALLTVTGTPADVVWLPAASRATADRVYDPFGVPAEAHKVVYGAVVSSDPMGEPLSRNWTPTTPTLSVASA